MSEGVERGFASVSSLPRVTNATKCKSRDGAMVICVVNGSTARCDFVENCGMLDLKEKAPQRNLWCELSLDIAIVTYSC